MPFAAAPHGDREHHPSLPLLMANDQPVAWAASQHREWHLGHWHVKRDKMFLPIADQQGVLIRIVPDTSSRVNQPAAGRARGSSPLPPVDNFFEKAIYKSENNFAAFAIFARHCFNVPRRHRQKW